MAPGGVQSNNPERRNAAREMNDRRSFYDLAYARQNYFSYRPWLYRPYVRALMSLSGLGPGCRVLDAGCGQGFFSSLLAAEGLTVVGADLSVAGIKEARQHASRNEHFVVADLLRLPLTTTFDGVFMRSCSLFNVLDLSETGQVLDAVVRPLKRDGILLFVYNTNLSRRSNGWANHGMQDFRALLRPIARDLHCYLVNKLDVYLLGTAAFNASFTRVNGLLSRRLGRSSEFVGLCRVGQAVGRC